MYNKYGPDRSSGIRDLVIELLNIFAISFEFYEMLRLLWCFEQIRNEFFGNQYVLQKNSAESLLQISWLFLQELDV